MERLCCDLKRIDATTAAVQGNPLTVEDYRRLVVYQKSVEFEKDLHSVVLTFPFHYRRTLGVQLDNAAESIGANIAEGCGRKDRDHGNAELIRYLHVSFGSACEVEHRLLGAHNKKLIDRPTYFRLNANNVEIKRMTAGLIRRLRADDRGRGRQAVDGQADVGSVTSRSLTS
jgi:four helix bundle protein